ncbi:MAG: hypothetical protein H7232_05180 [Aeromicrobium sp.]|nr:hypothetical protein [Burkholderiales bacterium]
MPIKARIKDLQKWVKKDIAGDAPSNDRTEEALRTFVQSSQIDSITQARVLCFGCLYSLGPTAYRLIADPERFAVLMQFVQRSKEDLRTFRRFFRGLLKTYFSYDIDSATATDDGVSNWHQLRAFLANGVERIMLPSGNPDWVETLVEHRNVLTKSPCARYSATALRGDYREFKQLRMRLDVGDDAWLMRAIVEAQVQAALSMNDDDFKSYVPNLIKLLGEHAMLLDRGLGQILIRYAERTDTSINQPLCDFAVINWKNPWLPSNAAQWQHYPEGKALVTRWLQRNLLRKFFAILANDGTANTRRLDFWELYCEDATGMYFALGSAARTHGNQDFRAFGRAAAGLTLSLAGGGADLHGFVMVFGALHVVEFSQHGNRAYFYDTLQGDLPYDLSTTSVDVGAPSLGVGLKGGGEEPFSSPMRHADTSEMCWEGHFARKMKMTKFALDEFCRKWKCDVDDNRTRGGRLWIKPTDQTQWGKDDKLCRWAVLQGWGFRWVTEKKAAYLDA